MLPLRPVTAPSGYRSVWRDHALDNAGQGFAHVQHDHRGTDDGQPVHSASTLVQTVFAEALQHHQAGRLNEAERLYREVLAVASGHVDSLHLLGLVAYQTARLELAIEMIGQAISINPEAAPYHFNLGNTLKALGRLDEAIASYRRVVDLKPEIPEAHNSLAMALAAHGQLEEAIACYRAALALKPDFADAHSNLGNVLQQQGRPDEAVACYRAAISFRPDLPDAHNNLGNVLREQGWRDEAVACYRRAIELRPDYAEAHNNLGGAFMQQGRPDLAVACYRTAISIRADFADPHANLAVALLLQGDMAAGWAEFEWRWKTPQMIKTHRDFAQPQWHGEAAEGRTLLLHAEQGFGDTIQFCRYAALAAARGLRVTIEVPKPLVRLLQGLPGADRVMQRGEQLPAFDYHCPMLSMPLALGTTLATIPGTAPYLHAGRAEIAAWRMRLSAMVDRGFRVGLAWAGSAATPSDPRRSLVPDRLAPLFDLPGLHFFSLQKAGPRAPETFPFTDVMDEMEDFADTAALIANLDLVISVDTAVAHLAAALGKPVWMLDRFDPDWRWLTGRRDSPWYPTLRLYRQPAPRDWDAVIAEVAGDLRSLTAARPGRESGALTGA
jgi:tetratricopeptide (TPR) repeat protein